MSRVQEKQAGKARTVGYLLNKLWSMFHTPSVLEVTSPYRRIAVAEGYFCYVASLVEDIGESFHRLCQVAPQLREEEDRDLCDLAHDHVCDHHHGNDPQPVFQR